jgi:hypothetical protein
MQIFGVLASFLNAAEYSKRLLRSRVFTQGQGERKGITRSRVCVREGNVFVDPRTMPPWLENVVGVNPITHLATAVRGLMHGTATAGQIGWVLLTSKNYT